MTERDVERATAVRAAEVIATLSLATDLAIGDAAGGDAPRQLAADPGRSGRVGMGLGWVAVPANGFQMLTGVTTQWG